MKNKILFSIIGIFLLLSMMSFVISENLYEYHLNNSDLINEPISQNYTYSQNILVGSVATNEDFTITKISLLIRLKNATANNYTPIYPLNVSIVALNGSDYPTGAVLSNGLISLNGSGNATYAWHDINMSSYDLKRDTKYGIYLSTLNNQTTTCIYEISTNQNDHYAGGYLWYKLDGNGWQNVNYATAFKVYGEAVPPSYLSDPSYQAMDSAGAGLGMFLIYLSQALPILLLGLGFIGVIIIIGYALRDAIKNSFNFKWSFKQK